MIDLALKLNKNLNRCKIITFTYLIRSRKDKDAVKKGEKKWKFKVSASRRLLDCNQISVRLVDVSTFNSGLNALLLLLLRIQWMSFKPWKIVVPLAFARVLPFFSCIKKQEGSLLIQLCWTCKERESIWLYWLALCCWEDFYSEFSTFKCLYEILSLKICVILIFPFFLFHVKACFI
jgi:hypothetical protein